MSEPTQESVRVVPAEEQDSVVGKPEALVVHGSRLSKIMGQGKSMGHPEVKKGEDIPPSRVAMMMQGKRLVHEFDWPGVVDPETGEPIRCGVVVLTEAELEEAAVWASERMKDARTSMDEINFQHQWTQEQTHQILWRALIDPLTGLPFAASPEELRTHLTREVTRYLADMYDDWEQQVSPLSSPSLTEEQSKSICEALKKGQGETTLLSLDAASLRMLIKCLVSPSDDSPPSS